ncbi:probable palmitoyltransferase ZDHHC24 [Drosophila montana]|uniref:probable palmitoyltransferase ZDHHC24 n=1 Tax=Drosophila montana TaxID=40370 RepID=UPI00313E237C
MKFRRNPLPSRRTDILCFLTVAVLIPAVFLFDIIVLLPEIHEPGGFLHTFTFLMAMFLLFNIKGNMLACMMIDTSVDLEHVKAPPASEAVRLGWRHCTTCDRLAPPRSWHCKICGVCILRRDHHCFFMGCCIGQQNMRHFMCFTFYLFIATLYTMVYELYYVFARYIGELALLNAISRQIWDEFAWSFNCFEIALKFTVLLKLLSAIGAGIALGYFVPLVLRGEVTANKGKQHNYNCGIYNNLKSVFGQRMYFVWISPLLRSELPDDSYILKTDDPGKIK